MLLKTSFVATERVNKTREGKKSTEKPRARGGISADERKGIW